MDSLGHSYVLTTQELPNEKVASFGMTMHPIDSNIFYGIMGNDIYLYKCGLNERFELRYKSPARIKYEMYDYSWKLTIKAGLNGLFSAVKSRINKLVK